MKMSPICFVCRKSDSGGKNITCFTEETLKKCLCILKLRRSSGFKYKDLTIPSDLESSGESGYHVTCYRKFTAVAHKEKAFEEVSEASVSKDVVCTRSQAVSLPSSSTGVISKICIFCQKNRKQINNKDQALFAARTNNFEKNVRDVANQLGDYNLLSQIDGDFAAKEVHYHQVCWLKYRGMQRKAVYNQTTVDKEPCFEDVMNVMMKFIDSNVVEKKQAYHLSALHKQFLSFHEDILKDTECNYSAQHLEEKITKTFADAVRISKMGKNKVIHHPEITLEQLHFFTSMSNDQMLLQQAAMKIRNDIHNIKPTTLPTHVNLQDIKNGEVEIPNSLLDFLTSLIGGSDVKRRESERTARLVKSLAHDIIFASTNGRLKPSKHIMLGLCMSGLTSSRKVIEILNRYGHTLSYSTLEGIETELCYSDVSSSESTLSPSALIKSPELTTGVAFDNFDRYVETTTGKDTLHDTVGIAYQIYTPSSTIKRPALTDASDEPKYKRRRMFQSDTSNLEPYRQKPKFHGTLIPLDCVMRQNLPKSLIQARLRDLLWMLSLSLNIPDTPMWIGFNARFVEDLTPLQKVFYLPPINQSPTSSTVVYETMNRAKQIASECKQQSILVTYDLAIAKVALQIQNKESPLFDNLFIQIGDFHTMMAYFHAVGKYIEDCGLTDIMVASDTLATGSVNGFISGKHFNRCKRIHPIASVSLQILHFQSFLRSHDISVSNDAMEELEAIGKLRTDEVSVRSDLRDIIEMYTSYCKDTLAGKHGKTPQFYLIYINLIQNYLVFSRSIREGNHELYTYIIPRLTNLFFAFNHPNYARWSVKYHDNLMSVNDTHPDLVNSIKAGCFAVKRTSLAFSRSPVDLTLEQTVNADAANKLTGISHFTNSISARERWTRFHSIKAEIISTTLEETGLIKRNEVVSELSAYRIKKDRDTVDQLIHSIKRHINPFDETLNKTMLFNIATGKGVRDEISDFLLNVEENGEKMRSTFISECSTDSERLEKPIKKQKILTFADDQKKIIRKTGDEKLQDEISNKNLFGRVLAVSSDHKVDMVEVLKYPLTATPRSLSHSDGTFTKTDKSALMNHLEKKISTVGPKFVDVAIIDGFFLLHTIGDIPRTLGLISRKFLHMVTNYKAKDIHVVFDQYLEASIKSAERERRAQNVRHEVYAINGPDQVKPGNFMNCLKSSEFKTNFVKFIINHWQDPALSEFFRDKSVFVNDGNICYQFTEENGITKCVIDDNYSCSHEEADTRICYIASKLPCEKNIVVRCSDTDVLIILLGNFQKLPAGCNVWQEVGFFNNNSLRYIDINKVFAVLGEDVCRALPGVHAFTGSDTTSCFFKKGKVGPFKIMEKNEEFINYFKSFYNPDSTSYPLPTTTVEKFVCCIYNIGKCETVDEARYRKFEMAFKPRKLNEPLSKSFSAFDSMSIPPCKLSLLQHIKRSILQTYIWMNADKVDPLYPLVPTDFGWKLQDSGTYEPVWFDGEFAPPVVLDAIAVDNQSDDEDSYFDCSSDDEEI